MGGQFLVSVLSSRRIRRGWLRLVDTDRVLDHRGNAGISRTRPPLLSPVARLAYRRSLLHERNGASA